MKALDDLRLKAEQMTEANVGPFLQNVNRTRRPTWAPPLDHLGEELVTLLFDLDWLSADELAIARLWARFTSPQRGSVQCVGFELIAGQKHERSKTIWCGQHFDKDVVLANIQRQIELTKTPQYLAGVYQRTQAKQGGWSFGPRWSCYFSAPGRLEKLKRTVELGYERVMRFAGADVAEEMKRAGRYWGHCCCCGKALTVPHSIELGVGPECFHKFGMTIPQAPGAWIIGGSDAA